MEPQKPKVTLMTHTALPLETVFAVWEASKSDRPLRTPQQIKDEVPREEIVKLFNAVIAQRIPIGEHIDFVFMFEHISISWREQAVRHRIGTTASPERIGADMVVDVVPNMPDSSFWSQSFRIQDMRDFAKNGDFRMPETVYLAGPEAVDTFMTAMHHVADAYQKLVDMGVPMEDARELMPLGAQHRMSWRLNISSLQHIIGKRTCWILQGGLWGPIIDGMIKTLVEVDPAFASLSTPPCISQDKYKGCVFQEESRRRYTQDDRLPPCPLHFAQEVVATPEDRAKARLPVIQEKYAVPRASEMRERAKDYQALWQRDPYTGEPLYGASSQG
jgi:hypothetical protein